MSLNTRCPACETVFKVVPDQLKVSSGWVRCGRCSEVFDAATHMLSSARGQAMAAPPRRHVFETGQVTPPRAISTPQAPPLPAPEVSPNSKAPVSAAPMAANIKPSEVPELSFVRHAKNRMFWQQVHVVRSLLALSLGLIGVLAFQVVLDQRNQLAAAHPGWQAGLESFCSVVGCVIEPVKQLEALKIESSSFQKIQESPQGDTFALKVTLKSSAAQPLAAPALELTLTDVNDKPVLRRVLSVHELGFQGKTLAALGEWNGALSIFVSANPPQKNRESTPVTGYRLLAFYP